MRTAVIAGASGLTGKLCLYYLLEHEEYTRVVSLVRKPIPIKHPKLEQVVIDFNKPELISVAGDDVFCCLGTTIKKAGSQENFRKVDFEYPLALAKQLLINGAKQLMLISAMGADKKSAVFYNRVKGETESAVSGLGFKAVKIFRPSILLGSRDEFRPGEWVAQVILKPLSVLFVGPLKKYKPVTAETVAMAMVNVALNKDEGVHIYENDRLFTLAV